MNAQLIRRVDEVIASGLGGFTTREELIEEALNSYLLELRDINFRSPDLSVGKPVAGTLQEGTEVVRDEGRSRSVPTRIISLPSGFATQGDEMFVEDVPLLGLHNRDWPSLWALSRLAHVSAAGPVPFASFLEDVTAEAWRLAASLQAELGAHAKPATLMLPTNVLKKQSANIGFQNFAVGSVSSKPHHRGLHKVTGPLPVWRAIAFLKGAKGLQVSLTKQGWELLKIVDGLGADQPHNRGVAEAFFSYLRANSPSDWWGFETMLREVSHTPTRDALLTAMADAREWSPSIASSATQGYIARSREWGLVEPKLTGGTYRLTDFGKETLHNVQR